MTFQQYFTECQTLITKEIDLPFDKPYSQPWIDKFTPEFEAYHGNNLTPDEAVKVHFADIESRSLKEKKRKTLMKK